jgi:hypothetical protein
MMGLSVWRHFVRLALSFGFSWLSTSPNCTNLATSLLPLGWRFGVEPLSKHVGLPNGASG